MLEVACEVINSNNLNLEKFNHIEDKRLLENPLCNPWTTVYDFPDNITNGRSVFSCFAEKQNKDAILDTPRWMIQQGDFHPHFEKNQSGVEYRTCAYDGFYPIVIATEFHELNTVQLCVNQEFTLLFNLYRGKDGNFYEGDDTDKTNQVIRIEEDRVSIRTKYLMRFMAAKQLLFAMLIDSRNTSGVNNSYNPNFYSEEIVKNDVSTYQVSYQIDKSDGFISTRFLGGGVVLPKTRDKCDLWPYESSNKYPEFIIGEAPDGTMIKYTCNPDALNDCVDSRPDSPNYLTPVYFKAEVLDHFRKHKKYIVDEYGIKCGASWSVKMDHTISDRVMIYLGDLGANLPFDVLKHMLPHNVSPVGYSIANEIIKRDILCDWNTDSSAPITSLKINFYKFREKWKEIFGFDLYLDRFPENHKIWQEIRIPTCDNEEEFNIVMLNLYKVIIESINVKELKGTKQNQTIKALEVFCSQNNIQFNLLILEQLRIIRSNSAAHYKNANFEELKKTSLTGDAREDAKIMISNLTEFFKQSSEKLSLINSR